MLATLFHLLDTAGRLRRSGPRCAASISPFPLARQRPGRAVRSGRRMNGYPSMAHRFLDDRDRTLLFGEAALQPGDAVVHFDHGLARYGGETTVEVEGEEQRLTVFVYRNGGKLMLPAVEGRDFWAYGAPADEIMLDRLNAGDWVTRRDEMIAELRESADRLIKEDRARRARKAKPVVPDVDRYAAFAETFEHEETEDQNRAIEAVLADLRRGGPHEPPADRRRRLRQDRGRPARRGGCGACGASGGDGGADHGPGAAALRDDARPPRGHRGRGGRAVPSNDGRRAGRYPRADRLGRGAGGGGDAVAPRRGTSRSRAWP